MTEGEMKLARAAKLVGRGKVSRRDFIQLALASGLFIDAGKSTSRTEWLYLACRNRNSRCYSGRPALR